MMGHTKRGAAGDSFKCEANGLKELAKADALPVAKVISYGPNFITTEYIAANQPSKDFFKKFGMGLALLHKYKQSEYGFFENNFIGATPQLNLATEKEKRSWSEFFFNKRVLFQYLLLEQNGLLTENIITGFRKLERVLPAILDGVEEEGASLLHGDLWSGNYICNTRDKAVLIDPAVYYGHRETDLAMTRLFGYFPSDFYKAYNEEYPLTNGWREREKLYQLYHLMNHLNIFGTSYRPEVERLLSSI
ncbi:MAG: fructosamine kinase family protein [Bacteroidales bacterium]|jgi:fructosamine-3-kinase|nr:fructosamine kinase family protein [Bacteroidales bacterium]